MPTPNERTVPTPERDEDLEAEIRNAMNSNSIAGQCLAENAIRAVAAFSARRAREKTIEEFEAAVESCKQECDGKKEWSGAEVCHAVDIALAIEKLKHDAFTSGSVAEICSMQDKFDALLSRARQESHSAVRREALKEMDEAHQRCANYQERMRIMEKKEATSLELEMYVEKLRQEYQTN